MFQQVVHKGGKSYINYIKIFQNAKALKISVGNIYTEDQLMKIFKTISRRVESNLLRQQSTKNNQEENINSLIKNHYLYLT